MYVCRFNFYTFFLIIFFSIQQNSDIGDVLLNKVCDHYNLNEYKEYFGLKFTLADEKGNYEIVCFI